MKKLFLAAALCLVATPVLACPNSDKNDRADNAPTTKTADKDKKPAPKPAPKKPAPKKQDPKAGDGTKVSIK